MYNFFHQDQLKQNKKAYKKYGLKRPVYFPISRRVLEKINQEEEKPWLDVQSLKDIAKENEGFQKFSQKIQDSILDWSENGYTVIPRMFSEEEVDTVNSEIERLLAEKKVHWRYRGTKIMFAYRHSEKIRAILDKTELRETMSFLMGRDIRLFSSINFHKGSEQLAHSDSVHMTTYPEGFLIAAWIALENITQSSGPLTYYPGSHKLPYIYNEHYDHGGSTYLLGKAPYDGYEAKIREVIAQNSFESKTFLPQKGDVLIWHANLLHGGSPMLNKESTRKSMVLHYYADDVICYHEITQRPTLWA